MDALCKILFACLIGVIVGCIAIPTADALEPPPQTPTDVVDFSNSPVPEEFVRLQCYFEDERQMVLLRRTEGIADLLRKLREQFDADEGGLIVKYEEDGELYGLKSQDNLIAALRGLDHSQKRSLNLFIWPKQKSKQAPITIVLGDSEHHARSSSRGGSEIPLWVPTLTSSLGFVALIAVAIVSAGSVGIDAMRKIGTEDELRHADWLHIFKTQSSQYWPTIAECVTYFSLSWLAIIVFDVDPQAIHWSHDNQLIPCVIGLAYGLIAPYLMRQLGKFLKMLKKRSAERKAREEAERRARILRLKASKRSGGVLPTEGSTTDSESESEDVPARARRMSKSEEAASAGNKGGDAGEDQQQQQQQQRKKTKAKSKKAAALVSTLNVPALVTNVAHEVSYVFLSNALYFSSCYFWTESVIVSCIGSQLLSIAAREFMEGIITIGIGLWVYLFIAYFAFIPSFLLFVSALAWLVINILAPTKPRYDYIALMLFTDSLPCSLCAAAAWATYREFEKHYHQEKDESMGATAPTTPAPTSTTKANKAA